MPQNDNKLIIQVKTIAIPAEMWYAEHNNKEAITMRKTLEDIYYGTFIPSEQKIEPGSEMSLALGKATQCEQQLMKRLGEEERAIFEELADVRDDISTITARENFILGFRMGVRMMIECMDDDDGDLKKILNLNSPEE